MGKFMCFDKQLNRMLKLIAQIDKGVLRYDSHVTVEIINAGRGELVATLFSDYAQYEIDIAIQYVEKINILRMQKLINFTEDEILIFLKATIVLDVRTHVEECGV